ncbi:MAG TPA: carbonic anhydrase [Pirellulaceae bacterium]|nr:carbonic anhydrase [Pirellulaceae bacterium]
MEKLIAGVHRFRRLEYPAQQDFFQQLANKDQKPVALFITCADSRVHPNLITQTEPGDLFLIRNAGNIVPPHGAPTGGETATIEYAVEVLGIRNIIICGHSQCGAMQALLGNGSLDHLPAVKAWCAHAEATRRIVRQKYRDLSGHELAVAATEENILVQMNNLSTHPCVAARLASDELHIFGWYYDIGCGLVLQYVQHEGRFVEINDEAHLAHPRRNVPSPGQRLALQGGLR